MQKQLTIFDLISQQLAPSEEKNHEPVAEKKMEPGIRNKGAQNEDSPVYSLDSLEPAGPTFVRIREISKTKNPNGTWHRNTASESYIPTAAGNIEESRWVQMVKDAAAAEGEGDLFRDIVEYSKSRPWLKSNYDREQHAAHCIFGAYKHWPDFKGKSKILSYKAEI